MSCFKRIAQCHEFVDLGDDPLLLCKRRNGDKRTTHKLCRHSLLPRCTGHVFYTIIQKIWRLGVDQNVFRQNVNGTKHMQFGCSSAKAIFKPSHDARFFILKTRCYLCNNNIAFSKMRKAALYFAPYSLLLLVPAKEVTGDKRHWNKGYVYFIRQLITRIDLADIPQSAPLPAVRKVIRYFVFGDGRKRLFLLEFSSFHQLGFFCLYALQEFVRRFVMNIVRN